MPISFESRLELASLGFRNVAERGLFRGYALNAIDAKGRVAIPAPFRKTIETNCRDPFLVIGKHEVDPCLTGTDRNWSDLLQAQIERDEERAHESGRDFDRHTINRRAFGLSEDVGFDASGRFIMPSFFRVKAQLNDWVLFLAAGNVFELWNPQVLIATPNIDEDTKEVARYLLAERGVTQ